MNPNFCCRPLLYFQFFLGSTVEAWEKKSPARSPIFTQTHCTIVPLRWALESQLGWTWKEYRYSSATFLQLKYCFKKLEYLDMWIFFCNFSIFVHIFLIFLYHDVSIPSKRRRKRWCACGPSITWRTSQQPSKWDESAGFLRLKMPLILNYSEHMIPLYIYIYIIDML